MTIHRFDSGILSSNMYVLEENGHAVVIDPAKNTLPGAGLVIDLLLVTHEHYDHISGVNAWKASFHAPLLCSEPCAAGLEDPKRNMARHFDAFCEIQSWMQSEKPTEVDTNYSCRADRTFSDETQFQWQGHQFRLLEMPGHSPGSIGIFVDETHFFSGDSLLKGQEIELRFPGGSRKQWREIGEPRIEAVPKGTRIWPGHFESFILD